MARIAGVDLPRNKRIEIGLTYIFGIGRTLAKQICAEAQVDSGALRRTAAGGWASTSEPGRVTS